MTPVLHMKGIVKAFSGNRVLNSVHFQIERAEIHALLGHNGAGKSTLMKILLGVHQPDSGQILIDGQEAIIRTPQDARKYGLSIVHQELNLFPHLSVAENMFLGRELVKGNKSSFSNHRIRSWFQSVDKKRMREQCKNALARVGLDLDPQQRVANLSMAKRQLVEIAKALSEDANVLILDEPTSSLSIQEVKNLFVIMRNLAHEGVSIVFISHRLEEVFEICNTVTVLRDGEVIGSTPVRSTTTNSVIEMMVGKNVNNLYGTGTISISESEPVLKVTDLAVDGVFQDVNLTVNKGEIVGLAGLIGSGRTEVLESIFGARHYSNGRVEYKGKPVVFRSPMESVSLGIGFVPEDRRSQGLFFKMNVGRNISIVSLRNLMRRGRIMSRKEASVIEHQITDLNIKTVGGRQSIHELSGGNQQKVVLAKWLAKGVNLMLLDEPTRGVDINSKAEIYTLVRDFVAKGGAVLLASSELPEILGLCDRIMGFKRGRIVGELTALEANENALMEMIV